jgi:hypothetical protein
MGYSKYQICETGIRNKETGYVLTKMAIKDEYVYVCIRHDHGRRPRQSYHRLLAQVYMYDDNLTTKHVVEHINGIKHDNALSNLKWRLLSDKKSNRDDTTSKPVVQCRFLDESIVKIWNSSRQVEEEYNLTKGSIGGICNAAKNTERDERNSGDFLWIYAEDYEDNVPFAPQVTNAKPTMQYDLDGNLIKIFKNREAAAKVVNSNSGSITRACTGENSPIFKGYIWKSTVRAEQIQARARWEEYQASRPKLSKRPVVDPVPLVRDVDAAYRVPRVPITYNRVRTFSPAVKDIECREYGKYKVYANGTITKKQTETPLRYHVKNGYAYTYINGKPTKAHRVVCSVFKLNPENKPVVDHINGNKLDNRIDNLQWATYKENTDAYYALEGRPRRNVRSKTVYKIDSNGIIIGEYVSPTDASITDDVDLGFVKNQCYYKYVAGGERYLFEEEYNEIFTR